MSGEGKEGEEEGKLPSFDHGHRTDRGRDKNHFDNLIFTDSKIKHLIGRLL